MVIQGSGPRYEDNCDVSISNSTGPNIGCLPRRPTLTSHLWHLFFTPSVYPMTNSVISSSKIFLYLTITILVKDSFHASSTSMVCSSQLCYFSLLYHFPHSSWIEHLIGSFDHVATLLKGLQGLLHTIKTKSQVFNMIQKTPHGLASVCFYRVISCPVTSLTCPVHIGLLQSIERTRFLYSSFSAFWDSMSQNQRGLSLASLYPLHSSVEDPLD